MRSQLTYLVLVLAAVALGLYAIGATPQVPGSTDAGSLGSILRGSDLPASTIGYAIVDAAWLVWAWLVLSLALRVVVDLADGAARGAQWVTSLRLLSDAITLPLVRRAVDGAIAAVLVANVAMRAVPVAAAEPLAAPAPVAVVATVQGPSEGLVPRPPSRPADATHVVRPGETLWSISEQYYGSGQDYQRLVEANVGQAMGNGQVFSKAGVIQPGWSLRVPQASVTIENVEGTYWYTVESGDTLWGISGRVLGDETRWPELFDANRDTARMDDGRVLDDPNLIWPNLRLQLPPPIVGVDLDTEPAVPDVVAPIPPTTAPSAPPVTPSAPMPAEHATLNAFAVGGGVAAALAVMAAAGAALIARRRGRRDLLELPLSGDPQTDTPIRGGFAEIDPSREVAQPAMSIATQVQQATTGSTRLAMLKYGRTRSSAVIQSPPDGQSAARAAATTLATRLRVPIDVRVSRDRDVVLEMGARASEMPSAEGSRPTTLVPVCVLTDRRELWVDPEVGGHVLVASLPGAGADVVLTGLVATLAARRVPGRLKVWTIATPNQLPGVLGGLPHQVKPRADSGNPLETESALRDVRAELIRRMQRPEADVPTEDPEIVLVVGELADIEYSPHKTTLDMLGTYGPAHGVRLLAATRDSGRIADELLGAFGTRLVLRTATAEESQRLLAQPDAVDLLGGGQLWARVGTRQPLEGYGVRIRPDLLERFVRFQRSRHGLGPLVLPIEDVRTEEPVAPPHLLDLSLVDAEPGSALIHVRCFGGFEVHGPTGELIPTVDELTADAAWDVLAILASSPEGAIATAELHQRLWPDASAPDDALRGALAALHRLLLRGLPSLEGDVVRFAAGGATCHLDTRQVISDVHRFLRLCRAAPLMPPDQARLAWQRARALYRGALLDGPGARAWSWAAQADAESGGLSLRDRYREQAYAATRGLARLAAVDGRTEDAVMLYQELLSVEPTLEDVVRELCECYEQLGDSASIREEEVRLNRALQSAYAAAGPEDNPLAYEPEPATTAIFDRARASVERKVAAVVAD